MMWRRLALLSLFPLVGLADRLEPLPKPTDYAVNGEVAAVAIGAEYLAHSVAAKENTFVVDDYVVVEVGFYPAKGHNVQISSNSFTLRVNGKSPLFAQTPGMVAASLKYGDWEQRPTLEGGAGVGGVGTILGRPRQQPRFPGDESSPEARQPNLPRVPTEVAPVERREVRGEDVVVECALEEGLTTTARRGFLYFPWKGKLKSIKSVVLLYNSDAGNLTLKLY